jgi:hypothetical protein
LLVADAPAPHVGAAARERRRVRAADLSACIDELARVLAEGGALVYSDFHPASVDAGFRRTFQSDGTTFEIPCHRHALEEHREALHARRLTLRDVHELRLVGNSRPVLAVFHAVKQR